MEQVRNNKNISDRIIATNDSAEANGTTFNHIAI